MKVLFASALALCMAVSSAHISCCPTCPPGFSGQCQVANTVFSISDQGSDCLASCPGSCQKTATDYICGLEPCGPDPCSFDSDLLGSKPVGYCLPGQNTTGYPLRDGSGWLPSYGYHVSYAHAIKAKLQPVIKGTATSVGYTGHLLKVSPYGNSIFYPVHVSGKYWTLRRYADTMLDLQLDLGNGAYPHSYAASDDVVAVATYSIGEQTLEFTTYSAKMPNTTISSTTQVPPYQGSIPFPAVVHNSTVHVLMPIEGGISLYGLFMWDATDLSTFRQVNVTLDGCNTESEAASRVNGMWVTSDSAYLYFSAINNNDPAGTQLCKMEIATGVVSTLLPAATYTRAHSAVEVTYYDDAVIYTAASGSAVDAGGTVVCRGLQTSPKCVWVQYDMQANCKYEFTSVYPGYHLPPTMNTANAAALYGDILIYQAAGGLLHSFFMYNLTSRDVQPIALIYDVPNTKCGEFTGDSSVDIEITSFEYVAVMANGSLVLGTEYTSNVNSGQALNDIVLLNSPGVLPDQFGCPGGCSTHGGFCDNGQCTCFPGCSGADCTMQADGGNATYCNPPEAADDDF